MPVPALDCEFAVANVVFESYCPFAICCLAGTVRYALTGSSVQQQYRYWVVRFALQQNEVGTNNILKETSRRTDSSRFFDLKVKSCSKYGVARESKKQSEKRSEHSTEVFRKFCVRVFP